MMFLSRSVMLIVLVCSAFLSLAQQKPQPYVLSNDTAYRSDIPDSLVLFTRDPSGKLSLKDVKSMAESGTLKPWAKSLAGDSMKMNDHWFYYRIQNGAGKDMETGLDSWANISEFHVIRQNGETELIRTGDFVPWDEKKEFRFYNISSISLKKDETVDIFYRAKFENKRYQQRFRLSHVSPNVYARRKLSELELIVTPKDIATYNFYFGFFVMAALVYFFFYFLVRERVFLFFGLFTLLLAASASKLLYDLALEFPAVSNYVNLINPAAFLMFTLFFREYFDTRTNLPKWDKYLVGLGILFLAVSILDIYFEWGYTDEITLAGIIMSIFAQVATPFQIKGKMLKEKRFLLYAALPFLILLPLTTLLAIVYMVSPDKNVFATSSFFVWFTRNSSIFMLLTFIWMLLSFSRILIRRFNEQRQRIKQQEQEKKQMEKERELERLHLIERQKVELEQQVSQRTAELKQSLEELRTTQTQLIQSEKMASLGEMTAGIAHEIQNPLNFVNNFAEVNMEIVEEVGQELAQMIPDGEKRAALMDLLKDLKENQEKIRHHGKRADNIVKNMLMHSRKGAQQKEPIDLNELVQEYVNLSYHGLRARDKSFNAEFELNLDPEAGKIHVLAQDMGRVILNLVNNAFYAVNERKRTSDEGYRPRIIIKTRKEGKNMVIAVSDNGNGIPAELKEKIFQPFFTTKPTGEGTGLGLSISYDIITKGHGGQMKVESKEGEGTQFTITIPAEA